MLKEKTTEAKETANEITDVRDIVRNLLITKTGYKIGFLRLFTINIDLLTKNEKKSKCNTLTAEFKPEKEPFILYSIPRTIDMDTYLTFLEKKYDNEMSNPKRKMLLNAMIGEATEKVMNGQNYEHQFYIKTWEKEDKKNCDRILEDRLNDFRTRFNSIQNDTKRIDDIEIIKLCNLFGNSNTAVLEEYNENTQYEPFPLIQDLDEKEER